MSDVKVTPWPMKRRRNGSAPVWALLILGVALSIFAVLRDIHVLG